MVPPHSEVIFSFYPILFQDNRDLLFHTVTQDNLIFSTHIIDVETMKVLIRNTSNLPLRISHQHQLGYTVSINYNNCFFESALQVIVFPFKTLPFFEHEFSYIPTPTDSSIETRLDNNRRVYGDKQAVTFLAQCVVEYLSIQESKGFIQILSKCWMKVSFKLRWEVKISAIRPRVYSLRNNAYQLIDKTFDRIYYLNHLKFTMVNIPFSFLVFIVQKTDVEGKKKGRVVVNICSLNKIVLPNAYSLHLQSKIIANVQGCINLTILNIVFFFY